MIQEGCSLQEHDGCATVCDRTESVQREDREAEMAAFRRACAAGDYQAAFDILLGGDLHIHLDGTGQTALLVSALQSLLAAGWDRAPAWTEQRRRHGLILCRLGVTLAHAGQAERAVRYLKRSLREARETRDRLSEAVRWSNLSSALRMTGDPQNALQTAARAVRLARALDHLETLAHALCCLGAAYVEVGLLEAALIAFREARALFQEQMNAWGEGWASLCLGTALFRRGDGAEAETAWEIAAEAFEETGDTALLVTTLCEWAAARRAACDFGGAVACLRRAERACGDAGSDAAAEVQARLEEIETAIGPAAFRALWADATSGCRV